MPNSSIPDVGSRVSVQMFARDLLNHQGLIRVETYPSSGYYAVVLDDGSGVLVAVTGDRSSLRMILSAALAQFGPDVTDSVADIPVSDDKGVEDGK